jgi:hypothetical protein
VLSPLTWMYWLLLFLLLLMLMVFHLLLCLHIPLDAQQKFMEFAQSQWLGLMEKEGASRTSAVDRTLRNIEEKGEGIHSTFLHLNNLPAHWRRQLDSHLRDGLKSRKSKFKFSWQFTNRFGSLSSSTAGRLVRRGRRAMPSPASGGMSPRRWQWPVPWL